MNLPKLVNIYTVKNIHICLILICVVWLQYIAEVILKSFSHFVLRQTLSEAFKKDQNEKTTFRVKILKIGETQTYENNENKKMAYFCVTGGAEDQKVNIRVYAMQFKKTLKCGADYMVTDVSIYILYK